MLGMNVKHQSIGDFRFRLTSAATSGGSIVDRNSDLILFDGNSAPERYRSSTTIPGDPRASYNLIGAFMNGQALAQQSDKLYSVSMAPELQQLHQFPFRVDTMVPAGSDLVYLRHSGEIERVPSDNLSQDPIRYDLPLVDGGIRNARGDYFGSAGFIYHLGSARIVGDNFAKALLPEDLPVNRVDDLAFCQTSTQTFVGVTSSNDRAALIFDVNNSSNPELHDHYPSEQFPDSINSFHLPSGDCAFAVFSSQTVRTSDGNPFSGSMILDEYHSDLDQDKGQITGFHKVGKRELSHFYDVSEVYFYGNYGVAPSHTLGFFRPSYVPTINLFTLPSDKFPSMLAGQVIMASQGTVNQLRVGPNSQNEFRAFNPVNIAKTLLFDCGEGVRVAPFAFSSGEKLQIDVDYMTTTSQERRCRTTVFPEGINGTLVTLKLGPPTQGLPVHFQPRLLDTSSSHLLGDDLVPEIPAINVTPTARLQFTLFASPGISLRRGSARHDSILAGVSRQELTNGSLSLITLPGAKEVELNVSSYITFPDGTTLQKETRTTFNVNQPPRFDRSTFNTDKGVFDVAATDPDTAEDVTFELNCASNTSFTRPDGQNLTRFKPTTLGNLLFFNEPAKLTGSGPCNISAKDLNAGFAIATLVFVKESKSTNPLIYVAMGLGALLFLTALYCLKRKCQSAQEQPTRRQQPRAQQPANVEMGSREAQVDNPSFGDEEEKEKKHPQKTKRSKHKSKRPGRH